MGSIGMKSSTVQNIRGLLFVIWLAFCVGSVTGYYLDQQPSCRVCEIEAQNPTSITIIGQNFPVHPCVEIDCNRYTSKYASHNSTVIIISPQPPLDYGASYDAIVFDCSQNTNPCFVDHNYQSTINCGMDFTSGGLRGGNRSKR